MNQNNTILDNGWRIDIQDNTLGITRASLNRLRDILVLCYAYRTSVIIVPTDKNVFGYLFCNHDSKIAFFTGDGFRTDNGGEGGAGKRTAERLLELFSIDNLSGVGYDSEPAPYNSEDELYNKLSKILTEHLKEIDEGYTSGIMCWFDVPYVR
jgi:hypothetical protein